MVVMNGTTFTAKKTNYSFIQTNTLILNDLEIGVQSAVNNIADKGWNNNV